MPTTRFTVTGSSQVTPTITRVHLRTDDLSAFADSTFTDRYVKLVFPKTGVEYPDQIDVRGLRGVLPAEQLPDVRTYTVLHPDGEAGTIDIDFVLHGPVGIAGPWASAAKPGDELIVNGPGGAYRPDPDAAWHLLVGDESAIPAITAALDALPGDAVARVVLVVDSVEHEPRLMLPRDGAVTFVHRGGDTGAELEGAMRAVEWLDGPVHAFVHGEAEEIMKSVRPYLRAERGVPRESLSISGYWRRGRTEDGFREWKAEQARLDGERAPPTGGRR